MTKTIKQIITEAKEEFVKDFVNKIEQKQSVKERMIESVSAFQDHVVS